MEILLYALDSKFGEMISSENNVMTNHFSKTSYYISYSLIIMIHFEELESELIFSSHQDMSDFLEK